MSIAPVALEPDRRTIWASARGHLIVRSVLGLTSGRLGLAVFLVIVGAAFLGPVLAPHGENEVVGLPFDQPSSAHLLGTDLLGRDAFSRFLYGGATLVILAVLATALAYVFGISLGMASAYGRGPFDLVTIGAMDVLLAFPPIVFVLVLLAAAGTRLSTIVVGIALIHLPRIVRIVRSVTLEVATLEFVEAAVLRGERTIAVLFRDVLPNIWGPLLADFGIRLTGSVILFSSLSFLGLGQAPPNADWGLLISENRVGLTIQPWVTLAPAAAIAMLTISVNLMADAVARNLGRSTAGPE